MKETIAALVHHNSEADTLGERQNSCSSKTDSLFKYVDNKTISLPKELGELAKLIFGHKGLGPDELLQKCKAP